MTHNLACKGTRRSRIGGHLVKPEPHGAPRRWPSRLSSPIHEFLIKRDNRRLYHWSTETPALVCAVSGQSYTITAIAERLGLSPNTGSPWDKVIGVFISNTLNFLVASWAVHRIGGICLLMHPTGSATKIKRHIELAPCRVLFTGLSSLPTANEVLLESEVQDPRVYLLAVPEELGKTPSLPDQGQKTAEQLVKEEESFPPVDVPEWGEGQGKEHVAYQCPTSGTSGLQKLAMITHYNIIANIIKSTTFEAGPTPDTPSYGLILAHLTAWRGDTYVLHARFDMRAALTSIEKYKVERLYLVPPIISVLVNHPFLLDLATRHTESAVIFSFTDPDDNSPGADGCLVASVEARIINSDGSEVEAYNEPGELLLKSPSIMKGYLGQEAATQEVFDGQGWLRTGDIAKTTHLDIVDRKKDIVQVKGLQVAPVEVESHLAARPAVAGFAVVGVRDEDAGEWPYAFIVRSPRAMADMDKEALKADLNCHEHYIRFVDEFPKSGIGKPLKYKLKESLAV
ncbi:hypothetical protein BDW68DRAFT_189429 [Aspergillus falconensis]